MIQEIETEELYNQYTEYRNRLNVWKKNHGLFINDIIKLELISHIVTEKGEISKDEISTLREHLIADY